MSLQGIAESKHKLRGEVTLPDMIVGKSAYEIAVMHGFDGTEEEWLESLKGGKGEKGDGLPEVTADDNGKVLKVKDGAWALGEDAVGSKVADSAEDLPEDAEDGTTVIVPGEDGKADIYIKQGDQWYLVGGSDLPEVTEEDNGKVLTAKGGVAVWEDPTGSAEVYEVESLDALPDDAEDGDIAILPLGELPSSGSELPEVTADDDGKVLKVQNGAWALGDDEGGAEVIEVSSLDELPDDAEDGTVAVVPGGTGGGATDTDYTELEQRVSDLEEDVAGLKDTGVGFSLPIVELTTDIALATTDNPTTETTLSTAEGDALSAAGALGLPVIIKWSSGLFPFYSFASHCGASQFELNNIVSSSDGSSFTIGMIYKISGAWKFITWKKSF